MRRSVVFPAFRHILSSHTPVAIVVRNGPIAAATVVTTTPAKRLGFGSTPQSTYALIHKRRQGVEFPLDTVHVVHTPMQAYPELNGQVILAK
jgi:hypothetical protein